MDIERRVKMWMEPEANIKSETRTISTSHLNELRNTISHLREQVESLRTENEALRSELKECREKLPEPNSITMPRSVYEMMRKKSKLDIERGL